MTSTSCFGSIRTLVIQIPKKKVCNFVGGARSPRRAKVCLPHVLDAWLVKDVHPRRQGRGFRRRFAEDVLIGCACEAAARRMRAVRPKRFTRFRLTMHPEKTALMACKRPPSRRPSAGGT